MKLKASSFALLLAAMLAFAASAGAVDGSIEINQAKVLAGSGFPFTISASGSYRLTGNLSVPASTDGIDVSANNVTIDLNGFSIVGTLTTNTHGINASMVAGTTVENGTVTGFFTGMSVGSVGIVRNVHADTNVSGINGGNATVVEGCTANNTKNTGIVCSAECAISGNTANGNTNDGIACSGSGCVISGNTSSSNAIGVECDGTGCLISGNTINNNAGNPIKAADATTAYGWNVMNGDGAGVSMGTSMAGKNTNSCGGTAC